MNLVICIYSQEYSSCTERSCSVMVWLYKPSFIIVLASSIWLKCLGSISWSSYESWDLLCLAYFNRLWLIVSLCIWTLVLIFFLSFQWLRFAVPDALRIDMGYVNGDHVLYRSFLVGLIFITQLWYPTMVSNHGTIHAWTHKSFTLYSILTCYLWCSSSNSTFDCFSSTNGILCLILP